GNLGPDRGLPPVPSRLLPRYLSPKSRRYRSRCRRASNPSNPPAPGSYPESCPAAAGRRSRQTSLSSSPDRRPGSGRSSRMALASARPAPARLPASSPLREPAALSLPGIGYPIWLFFLAGFHAYVVFGLACLCGVIFRTRLLLIATLLASARFSSCCSGDAANTEHHNDNRSDRSHDDLLSMLGNAPYVTRSKLIDFSSCRQLQTA